MTKYKCPYCGQNSLKLNKVPFQDWLQVRNHAKMCKKSDKTYSICTYHGPIKYSEYDRYESIKDLKIDYPNLSFNITYFTTLRKRGIVKIGQKRWSPETIVSSIKDYYKLYNKVPEERDFTGTKYPVHNTVIKHCGSWNNAIKLAGFQPNMSDTYGTPTIALDGIKYKSNFEANFVNKYLYNKYSFSYELPYGNGWYFDFYIKELNLYIEVTDYIKPKRIVDKIEYCKLNNIKLLIVDRNNFETLTL